MTMPSVAELAADVRHWETSLRTARSVEHLLEPDIIPALEHGLRKMWGWYSTACEEMIALEDLIAEPPPSRKEPPK